MYLKPSLKLIRLLRPTNVHSLNLLHSLILATLGAWMRIAQSFTFLPLGTAINRVPLNLFRNKVVVKALRGFPQFESVAKCNTIKYTFH